MIFQSNKKYFKIVCNNFATFGVFIYRLCNAYIGRKAGKVRNLVPQEVIENKIYLIRGQKIMLDRDLAKLYGVPTKRLNEQVKRNIKRFPDDFMFQLTMEEVLMFDSAAAGSRSQFATLKDQPDTSKTAGYIRGKNIKYLPYAFTEQGVSMLSSVLNSERAIQVNIAIMRAFVKLKAILSTHKDLAQKIETLELKYKNHDMKLSENDNHIAAIFEAIRELMAPPPEKPRRMIGFKQE